MVPFPLSLSSISIISGLTSLIGGLVATARIGSGYNVGSTISSGIITGSSVIGAGSYVTGASVGCEASSGTGVIGYGSSLSSGTVGIGIAVIGYGSTLLLGFGVTLVVSLE